MSLDTQNNMIAILNEIFVSRVGWYLTLFEFTSQIYIDFYNLRGKLLPLMLKQTYFEIVHYYILYGIELYVLHIHR